MPEVHQRNGSVTPRANDRSALARAASRGAAQARPEDARGPRPLQRGKVFSGNGHAPAPKASRSGATLASFTHYATPGRDASVPRSAPLCAHCVALCCRYIALPLDNPESASDYDDIRWYLMHENIHVFVDDGQWFVAFATRCKNLEQDNRCRVYETRPRVCRGYDTDDCEYHGTEYRYEHLFTSAQQIEAFAEEKLGRKIFFRPRRKKPKLRRGRNGKRRVELPLA